MASDAKESSPLSVARDIVALAAAFLFFAGFVYRYFYTGYLGSPRVGETPTYEFVISSWTVFQHHPAAFVVPALVLVAIFAVRKAFFDKPGAGTRRWYPPLEALVLVAFAFGSMWWIYGAASSTASAVATETRRGGLSNAVEFVFADEVRRQYPSLQRESDHDHLRVLGRDDDFMYILDQPAMSTTPLPAGSVYAIPHDGIKSYVSIVP